MKYHKYMKKCNFKAYCHYYKKIFVCKRLRGYSFRSFNKCLNITNTITCPRIFYYIIDLLIEKLFITSNYKFTKAMEKLSKYSYLERWMIPGNKIILFLFVN